VRLRARIDCVLPEPVKEAAYYVTAEALANAVRHARAKVIDIAITASTGVLVRVSVVDDGVGLPHSPLPGVGFSSMREWAHRAGGELAVARAATGTGTGTAVTVEIPVAEA